MYNKLIFSELVLALLMYVALGIAIGINTDSGDPAKYIQKREKNTKFHNKSVTSALKSLFFKNSIISFIPYTFLSLYSFTNVPHLVPADKPHLSHSV